MRKNIFILLFITSFAFTVKAQDANDPKMQVMMKMQSLRNALLSKDSVTLSALLADDASYGHSTGLIQTKAQLIRDVMSGFQDYKSIEPSDMNIRIYDNTAVAVLKLKTSLIANGNPMDLNLNATFTWVKINNAWKLVARQAVKLPAADNH
ncbi:MAG TPA: nuclear transport factor 2 family protein [Parafilimonas sp.]|nr:nuclear transport factor 2 family protein [Parafilimonas sp.]